MNLQPLNSHVLLRNVAAKAKTAGGLYLPESAKERPSEGVVVSMASDVGEDLDVGDLVIYKRFAGEEISYHGEKLRLIQFADLLARVPQTDGIPE